MTDDLLPQVLRNPALAARPTYNQTNILTKVLRDPKYLLGPHLTQGLRNVGSLGRLALELSPSADIRDAMAASSGVTKQLRRGNLAQAGVEAMYMPAAILGMALPGSVGGAKKLLPTKDQPIDAPDANEQLALALQKVEIPKSQKIRAFHGTQHDFGEFKLEKIGTGEGVQAFGHGLYFTDEKDIANFYKDNLGTRATLDGKPIVEGGRYIRENFKPITDPYEEKLDDLAEEMNLYIRHGKPFQKTSYMGSLSKNYNILSDKLVEQKFQTEFRDPFAVPEVLDKFKKAKDLYKETRLGYMAAENVVRGIRNNFKKENFLDNLLNKAKKYIASEKAVGNTVEDSYGKTVTKEIEILEDLKSRDAVKLERTGKLYEVELDTIGKDLVDLDKPIGGQSTEIQKIIYRIASDEPSPSEVRSYDKYDTENATAALKLEIRNTHKKMQARKELQENFLKNLPNNESKEIVKQYFDDFEKGLIEGVDSTTSNVQEFWDRLNKAVPYSKYPHSDINEIYDVNNALKLAKPQTLDQLMWDADVASSRAFSDLFINQGIKGFKYSAAGSRGAQLTDKAKKHNYVIFDPKIINLLAKYGIVGPVAVTALAKATGADRDSTQTR